MSSKSAKGKVQNGNPRHNPVRGAGAVVTGGIVPHPPIMVPEVGGTQARKTRVTQDALLELGRRICRSGAETMVFISPHGPVLWDAVGVVNRAQLEGNLGRFGAREVAFTLHTDSTLLQVLLEQLAVLGVPNAEIGEADVYRLDHGITAPLYWLRKAGVDLPVVACGTAFISPSRLYGFGVAVQRAAVLSGRNVAVVASGDLSHRLLPEAPNGYDPYGPLFDRRIKEIVAAADPMAMIGLDPLLVERAGECGYRPMIMLFGAFDGFVLDAEVLSYEGPFGVGYMVAGLTPGREDRGRLYLEQLVREAEARIKTESFLVRIARKAIEQHLKFGRRVEVREIPPEFNRRAAVFVSLKKGAALRGCIGTVEPSQPDLVREVVENAVSAATRDPRFDPVGPSEVQDLTISVDVLGELEPVSGLEELDPKRYGVVVSSGSGRGLLLPDLEGVDTPEQQVSIARRKAGISAGEPVRIERFEVIRYY
jgi:AmmeMemoRadiSam system protein A